MRAVFPGRFQPFHRGHQEFVEQMADAVDEVIVGVGSAQASHTGRNPFTAGERVTMIRRSLASLSVPTYVIPIEDINRYAVWPTHVAALCPPFDTVYSNNPLVGRVCRETGLTVRTVELIDHDRYRGTEIRRRMVEGQPWKPLVPDEVSAVIDAIDGVARLHRVTNHPLYSVDAGP